MASGYEVPAVLLAKATIRFIFSTDDKNCVRRRRIMFDVMGWYPRTLPQVVIKYRLASIINLSDS